MIWQFYSLQKYSRSNKSQAHSPLQIIPQVFPIGFRSGLRVGRSKMSIVFFMTQSCWNEERPAGFVAKTSAPVPAEEIQPHSMTLPPRCFTVNLVYYYQKVLHGSHQTITHFTSWFEITVCICVFWQNWDHLSTFPHSLDMWRIHEIVTCREWSVLARYCCSSLNVAVYLSTTSQRSFCPPISG